MGRRGPGRAGRGLLVLYAPPEGRAGLTSLSVQFFEAGQGQRKGLDSAHGSSIQMIRSRRSVSVHNAGLNESEVLGHVFQQFLGAGLDREIL